MRVGRAIKMAYAGPLAVKRAFPRSHWRESGENDFTQAANVILHVYSDERARYLWSSLLRLETEWLLERGWFAVEALADALVAKRTLTGSEARTVIQEAFARHVREALGRHLPAAQS